MTRTLLYVVLGAATGVLLVHRFVVGGGAAGLTDGIQEFVDEVRIGMAEREAELRTELGLDGRHDVVDAGL